MLGENKSLIKRIILCGVATISMFSSMGALSHGSLAGVCEDEIKDIDEHLLSIQEDYRNNYMAESETFEDKLSRDYANGEITFEEYCKANDKIEANNFVNALLVPNNVDQQYKNSINLCKRKKEKLQEKKQAHQICCGVNTGLFAISGGVSLAMLKKRFDEIDEENDNEIKELQKSISKK